MTVIKTEHFIKDANGKYIYNTEAKEDKEKKKRKVLPVREMMIRDMNLARDIVLGKIMTYVNTRTRYNTTSRYNRKIIIIQTAYNVSILLVRYETISS